MKKSFIEECREALRKSIEETTPAENFERMVATGIINWKGEVTRLVCSGSETEPEYGARRPEFNEKLTDIVAEFKAKQQELEIKKLKEEQMNYWNDKDALIENTQLQNLENFRYFKNPSEKVKLAAVKHHCYNVFYMKNVSDEMQDYLAETPYFLANYFYETSKLHKFNDKLNLAAVKVNEYNIQFIDNPTEEMCRIAINRCARLVGKIKNATEEMQLLAVSRDGWAIQFIENPSETVKLAAVRQNGLAISYFKECVDAVKWAAIQQNASAVQWIPNLTEAMKIAAIRSSPGSILYIKDATEELWLMAVELEGNLIQHMVEPSIKIQLRAVKQSPWAIKYIKNPCEEVQIAAATKDPSVICYFEPTAKAFHIAAQQVCSKTEADDVVYFKNKLNTALELKC